MRPVRTTPRRRSGRTRTRATTRTPPCPARDRRPPRKHCPAPARPPTGCRRPVPGRDRGGAVPSLPVVPARRRQRGAAACRPGRSHRRLPRGGPRRGPRPARTEARGARPRRHPRRRSGARTPPRLPPASPGPRTAGAARYLGQGGRRHRPPYTRDDRRGRRRRGRRRGARPQPPGRRVHLAGTWDDGPGAGRPVPAGGSGGTGGSGEDALRADSRRLGSGPVERRDRLPQPVAARYTRRRMGRGRRRRGDTPAYRGPATPLAAERARQARIAVVGAVTERWAPEQAGPVHDNWQLAPPIGPSTDLWALGALLYRAVQGHAPYPEENAAELVQMVCGEPPAFAEECGPLRPVVESLLRQDPTERPDFEELRGWLRSLVRSAPGARGRCRRRHPAARRRDPPAGRTPPGRAGAQAPGPRRGARPAPPGAAPRAAQRRAAAGTRSRRARRASPRGPGPAPAAARWPAPRRLGRLLLVLILLLMAAAVAYAMLFMPEGGDGTGASPSGSAPATTGPGADRRRSYGLGLVR